jgi:hypothetical protein
MSVSADFCVSSNGVRLLEFFRDGKAWYEDAGLPREDFKIGAQVAYFLCANMDRVLEFAESEGLRPEPGFRDAVKVGKGFVSEVVWTRYEDFDVGGKTVRRPCIRLDWESGKGKVGTFNFGVEKAKAIIAMKRRVAEFAATYG